MSKQQYSRQLLAVAVLGSIVVACTHKPSSIDQINEGLAPFSSTKKQTVAYVAGTKRTLAAADINSLAVAYTALQEKANAYSSFFVEAVTTSSFDPAKNSKCATDFANAIASFDKAFASLAITRRPVLDSAWVPAFAQSLQSRWNQYSSMIAKMTPQTKADLIADLKRETVWPNYEDIATEAVVPTPKH